MENFELVPDEYCKKLKSGNLIKISDRDTIYRIGQIIYPKNGNPKDNGFVEFWPEHTIVKSPSMFKLHAIDKIEIKDDYKIITLKKDN